MSGSGESFSFLHLTDLHQGMDSQSWLWPNVEEEFFRDLEKIHEAAGPWDLVLFTGDLTQRGSRAEFEALNATLGRLYAHLAALGSSPVLLAVPGNHDLVRPDANDVPPEIEALLSWNERPRVVEQFWKKADSSYRKAMAAAFANYTAWWEEHPFPRLTPPEKVHAGIMPGDFSATVRKGNLALGIVGLNSTFLQLTAEVVEGMLTLDPRQLNAACGRPGADWARERNLCLLLTHHPPEWLTRDAQDALRGEIAPPRRFAAHLFGHMHQGESRSEAEGGAAARRFWQGCSLFGLEHFGKASVERMHGYSAGRIEIADDAARFRLWPRVARRHRAGHLHLVADDSFTLEDDDGTPPELIQGYRPPSKLASGPILGLRERRSTPRLEAVIPPERESSGGPRPPGGGYERSWYIERSSEEKARHCINGPGTPVILWAPADSGKTWILSHLLDSFTNEPDTQTIFLDLNGLGESHGESIEALLEPVTQQIFQEIGGAPEGVAIPRATFELDRIMVEHVLPRAERVIVAFDRADAICDTSVQDDFFGMLRDWAQWSDRSVWSRLRLVVSVRLDPNRLSSSGSPFANVAQPIRFGDFKENHLLELARRYRLPWGEAEIKELMSEVEGHPYLTRQVMFDAAVESRSPADLLADHTLRRAYLSRYRGWLERDANLAKALRSVRDANREGGAALRLKREAIDKLLRFGLIVESPERAGPRYRLRCRLFEDLCE